MRVRLARACVVASMLTLVPAFGASDALAQARPPAGGRRQPRKPKDKKPPAAAPTEAPAEAPAAAPAPAGAAPAKPQEIELDEPPAKDTGPVQAGQMSDQAKAAQKLFNEANYRDAAVALYRVYRGETNDDEGNKQIAQHNLAVSLFYLKFYQAAYGIFTEISLKPNHLRFNETLLWLATLAAKLPEPADIIDRVGKYSAEQVARFNNPNQRELYWHLNYLLGRYKYRNRSYEEAIALFERVDRRSRHYLPSQFFGGISYVQLRQSAPAVKSFKRVVQAIDDGAEGEGAEDSARLRDLAFLSMARTYYSASISKDAQDNPRINAEKLSLAVNNWNKVDVASEYWLDGLFEESWAYFMAGDYPHALGNIHTIQAPYFPNSFFPEADILRAQIYYATCQYDAATTIVARFQKKYEPIQRELSATLSKFGTEGREERAFQFFRDLKDGRATVSPRVKPVLDNALSDRTLLKHRDYALRVLGEEERVLASQPDAFKKSAVGAEVRDALDNAKTVAITNAGTLVLDRYQRNLDELNEHLRDAAKILIDINAAERGRLEEQARSGQMTREEARVYGVIQPDEEHVVWPFDGEYWRDELGFFRQVVVSKCGRLAS
ncbi:MAG: hypothetical protein MUF34_00690 [Polyangiaceae bacterium]|nr:hypothetical protein [Polyangiaceae bacterium]